MAVEQPTQARGFAADAIYAEATVALGARAADATKTVTVADQASASAIRPEAAAWHQAPAGEEVCAPRPANDARPAIVGFDIARDERSRRRLDDPTAHASAADLACDAAGTANIQPDYEVIGAARRNARTSLAASTGADRDSSGVAEHACAAHAGREHVEVCRASEVLPRDEVVGAVRRHARAELVVDRRRDSHSAGVEHHPGEADAGRVNVAPRDASLVLPHHQIFGPARCDLRRGLVARRRGDRERRQHRASSSNGCAVDVVSERAAAVPPDDEIASSVRGDAHFVVSVRDARYRERDSIAQEASATHPGTRQVIQLGLIVLPDHQIFAAIGRDARTHWTVIRCRDRDPARVEHRSRGVHARAENRGDVSGAIVLPDDEVVRPIRRHLRYAFVVCSQRERHLARGGRADCGAHQRCVDVRVGAASVVRPRHEVVHPIRCHVDDRPVGVRGGDGECACIEQDAGAAHAHSIHVGPQSASVFGPGDEA